MNRQQVKTTMRGPELDALVAEAKGWPLEKTKGGNYVRTDTHGAGSLPMWSTDIAAAWGLAEELSSEYEITINRHSPDGQATCSALFIIGPDPDFFERWYLGEGRTAPEAIARAYLLAKLEADD